MKITKSRFKREKEERKRRGKEKERRSTKEMNGGTCKKGRTEGKRESPEGCTQSRTKKGKAPASVESHSIISFIRYNIHVLE